MQRTRQLDLSRALQSSRRSLAAAARAVGVPQWCSQLTATNGQKGNGSGGAGSGGGNGHRGFLFELFELREGAYEKHFRALASLLCELMKGVKTGGVGREGEREAVARSHCAVVKRG